MLSSFKHVSLSSVNENCSDIRGLSIQPSTHCHPLKLRGADLQGGGGEEGGQRVCSGKILDGHLIRSITSTFRIGLPERAHNQLREAPLVHHAATLLFSEVRIRKEGWG